MRIRVLGPISVSVDGSWQDVPGRATRATLAALVIAARHVVPSDHLIDALWEGAPPPSAAASLHAHISRLRHQLGEAAIHHVANGYALEVPCSRIDACRFERFAIDAERLLPIDPVASHERATAALRSWRGSPFGDVGDDEFLYLETRRLEELRMALNEIALAAELEIGRLAEGVAALQSLVSEYPYRERLWYLLALGLARQGRRLEALSALSQYREVVGRAGLAADTRIEELQTDIENGTVARMR